MIVIFEIATDCTPGIPLEQCGAMALLSPSRRHLMRESRVTAILDKDRFRIIKRRSKGPRLGIYENSKINELLARNTAGV